jgi:indolepyruvate ferredoxin oxidoreductase
MGRESKLKFGPAFHVLLRVLASLKFLRGTRLDIFGYAHLRRVERELLRHYTEMIDDLTEALSPNSYDRAVELAELPELIKGYEAVKLANLKRYVAALEGFHVSPPAWSRR